MNQPGGKIVFAGGGTGGHIYPALATIEILKEKGRFDILYIGGYKGLETRIVPEKNIAFKKIMISGFHRAFTVKNLLFPLKVVRGLMQSCSILKKFQPQVVVGTGGYASGPVVYVAAKKGIPTLIQEQDSYPGVTTRMLAKYADVICLAYPEAQSYLKKITGEVLMTGNPVRKSLKLVSKTEGANYWGLDSERPVIFILGGSQGAHSINQAMAELFEELNEKFRVQFLWQTGMRNYRKVEQWPAATHKDVKAQPYFENMDIAYSTADIIVSRAGAITLAEFSLVRKPCVLVPYPYAAANHQEHNARTIADAGAAAIVIEDNQFRDNLRSALESLLTDKNKANTMTRNWQKFQYPDAAETIADKIVEMAKEVRFHETGKD